MAESLDTYSDFSEDELDPLTESFNKAANHVKSLVSSLDSSKLLELYSYYKQALEGKCNIPRPRFYEIQAKSKWDAWNSLGDLPKDKAKEKYINIVNSLDPTFETDCEEKQSWAAVSSFANNEQQLLDSEKTIFDYVKEGDIEKLRLNLKADLLNCVDEDGMSLVHWASDRGDVEILRYLLSLSVDVNIKDSDGQTPLHYAVSCDHVDCVELLIGKGANVELQDAEGMMPKDLTANDKILQLLNK